MSLGHRKTQQADLFIPATQIVRGPGHPFYTRLNQVLEEAGFDTFVEDLCVPYYKEGGRPSIPPGVYFRMVFVGYFEGLDSQRGIAWRCADSLGLRSFLGFAITAETPVHVTMTMIRQRLPEIVFEQVFTFVLRVLQDRGLLQGKTLGIDATTLEANAAMKSIVRKDSGADWKEYLRTLARAEGIEQPSEEDLRRLDRNRPDKKVSNQQWQSPTDPDSRIAKMKDGRTHLAYKAEHAVDLVSEAIVEARVTHADRGDADTGAESLILAQANLVAAGSEVEIRELVADKGYHDNRWSAECVAWGVRTYIPERRQQGRCWANKPPEYEAAFRANRRRVRGAKGRRLNRWRSERCERTFAHVCETGGGRRTWVRGLANVNKLHGLKCAAYNLGLLLRKVWGLRKPRNWEEGAAALVLRFLGAALLALFVVALTRNLSLGLLTLGALSMVITVSTAMAAHERIQIRQHRRCLTGC
jgi:transposase